ncbi:hypothetical protein E1281_32185 [Actinomadura sp. KC345]|uniref:hypothetical protein n=1 Tax=Actinomadura sp. KC345 TaxID=2530371 RepID=UPI001045C487|nr:hypothetical protein [Actinomadura sp. KC345]TDC44904.1 hypothetical protein E1281_32185 [Actinomadura sp. KC345]
MGATMTAGENADQGATPAAGSEPGGGAGGEAPEAGPGPRGPAAWHRFHYAVGVFLIAYGSTGLISAVLLWGDRQDEIEGYFGSVPATAVLVLVKVLELALVASAAAGVVLRRDVLLVPPTAGWMAGFAMLAVLDVFTARWGALLPHLLYLAAFVVLLFLSYGLSAKAQLAGAPEDGEGDPPGGGGRLTRTQGFALRAINRAAALTGPRPRPERAD